MSRSPDQIKDRIELAIIEEIQRTNLLIANEPENFIPKFVQILTAKITEITLDEIEFRKRY